MSAKLFATLLGVLVILNTVSSQTNTEYISSNAFRKMMLDHYRFTLVGGQAPTSGLKVETSKPSITLKGNIFSRKYQSVVLNLELESGLDNGFMQLVAGKKVNSYFRTGLGLNILFSNATGNRNDLSKTEIDMTRKAIDDQRRLLSRQIDTFMIIQTLIDDPDFHKYSFAKFRDRALVAAEQEYRQVDGLDRLSLRTVSESELYFRDLIISLLKSYKVDITGTDDEILTRFKLAIANGEDTVNVTKMLNDYDNFYDKLEKETSIVNDRLYDFEIALTKFNWNSKVISWLNLSFSGQNSAFALYKNNKESITDTTQFGLGVTLSYNWLKKWKEANRYMYLRGGTSIQATNNLSELEKFNYKREKTINTGPEVLSSKVEGIAYLGDLVVKPGFDLFLEGYISPLDSKGMPGLYIKPMFRHSMALINQNRLALDLGLVWNVINADKDAKNLLSIVPFVSWSNLLKEYKDATRTDKKSLSDLFSFNVKFGIPINIGK